MRWERRCCCLCHNIGWSLNNSFALFHTFKCDVITVLYSIFSDFINIQTHTITDNNCNQKHYLSLYSFFHWCKRKWSVFCLCFSFLIMPFWMYVDYFHKLTSVKLVYTLRNWFGFESVVKLLVLWTDVLWKKKTIPAKLPTTTTTRAIFNRQFVASTKLHWLLCYTKIQCFILVVLILICAENL